MSRAKKSRKRIPTISQLESEINNQKYKKKYHVAIKDAIFTLITVAAIAILVATLWLPVLKIYGSSMTPTFKAGDVVLSLKQSKFKAGDIIAFYYENKLLVKRYVAGPGDWVNIDDYGNVYVNGEKLDEPYIEKKSLQPCDITLPYQVPDGKYFLLGDKRDVSIDSRSSSVGCVSKEQLIGRIVFRIWPFNVFGKIGD